MYGDLGRTIAGQKHGLHDETETISAWEKMYPGDPVFQSVGDGEFGYGARIKGVVLTASTAPGAGNSIGLTVNGVTLDPVPFVDSPAETFRRIADSVNLSEALRAKGITAFLLEGEELKFRLSSAGEEVKATVSVSGGTAKPVFSSAPDGKARFRGVVRHMDVSYREGAGFFPAGTAVSVMTHGQITVPVAKDARPDNLVPAYVITSGDEVGRFTHVAEGNYDCGCAFRSERLEGTLALIEVNGLK